MGKAKKRNAPVSKKLEDVLSDTEDGNRQGESEMYDKEDFMDLDEEHQLASVLRQSSSRYGLPNEDVDELYAISDDDDLPTIDVRGKKKKKAKANSKPNLDDIIDTEEEPDELEEMQIWGKKKSYFYGGNPNDPKQREEKEDGGEDEAEAEAEESRALQLKQLGQLDEDDFLDAFSANDKVEEKQKESSVQLDLSKLSRKERLQLFYRECPEFSGIMADFNAKVKDARHRLEPILAVIADGALPSNSPAAVYVKTKHRIITNYCANVSAFLMFKTRRANLKLHPITTRLVQYKQLLDQMEELDARLSPEIDQILKIVNSNEDVKKARKLLNRLVKKKSSKVDHLPVSKRNKNAKRLRVLNNPKSVSFRDDDLTREEQRAVDMYEATRSKKKVDPESSSDEEEANPEKLEIQTAEDEDGDTKRAITYQMAKNKGLQPKRNKLQRNPRVKHRHKYEKAKIRRKGQIREIRTEVKRYSGEISGINARVKKGVKLM